MLHAQAVHPLTPPPPHRESHEYAASAPSDGAERLVFDDEQREQLQLLNQDLNSSVAPCVRACVIGRSSDSTASVDSET